MSGIEVEKGQMEKKDGKGKEDGGEEESDKVPSLLVKVTPVALLPPNILVKWRPCVSCVARQRLWSAGCGSAGVQPHRRWHGGSATFVAVARKSDTSSSRMEPSVWRKRHQSSLDHHSRALYVRMPSLALFLSRFFRQWHWFGHICWWVSH